MQRRFLAEDFVKNKDIHYTIYVIEMQRLKSSITVKEGGRGRGGGRSGGSKSPINIPHKV